MLTMQDALLALTRYWTEQGCMVVQPMNTEVGAGTLNPATALRVLGPEPWRVAYVEPSVRPDDSRYGDNPNRLQTHTQFQVILKPEPGDPQELYLGSLRALGIDIDRHDVRFVEDNWASPALGAWGLGWEVWLDGLEITQFTYFQQAGGMTLDPVSVEITYGMERIIMALQGVDHFKDIAYAPGISYGEAFGQAEYEMSRYYLDDADVTAQRGLFEAYAAEADRLVEARLPVPAHTYVLKCSQAFNVLDSRGAISTTERAQAFARMRRLAHSVAKLWVERRAELGYPLGGVDVPPAGAVAARSPQAGTDQTLAFEIGVEELPPAETTRAADAVRQALTEKLSATRLRHGSVTVMSSPRRIVALVEDIAPREDDDEQTVRGPRLSAAYDADGAPTRAAQGFARGQGIDVAELAPLSAGGGEYVGYVKHVPGRPAGEVLATILPEIVTGLRAEKNMRWRSPGLSYSRPIRWITALLGAEVVPFTVADLASGRSSRVHRTAAEPVITLSTATGYVETLRRHAIEPDAAVRRDDIVAQAARLAASAGGRVDFEAESALVDEVTNLVEAPVAILGTFDEKYLELPAAILTTVMKKHQRYFPVLDGDGRLLNRFVTIANGECDHDAVRAGNGAVLRARYEDAGFFWRNDLATPLAEMKERLARLTFETRLGSVAERADRVDAIAADLAARVRLGGDDAETLRRAGRLAKFDLGSELVIELSSLAGVMAREYARQAGEPDAVAEALYEMELPRQAGDALPRSRPGALLALADRFDLLAGLFAIGSEPTGSSDPFGLRRAALGVINILRAHPGLEGLTLREALAIAASHQPVPTDAHLPGQVLDFVRRRFEQLMLEQGHPAANIRAVAGLVDSPVRAERTLDHLAALSRTPDFQELEAAVQRVRRIIPAGATPGYDPALFDSPAEEALATALEKAHAGLRGEGDLRRFAAEAAVVVHPVTVFFDEVLVMADDPAVRANRLGLLAAVHDLAAGYLDWKELS
ncbi:glycyl-tRNA synthetase beta chain /glycyl-tRNA synthetase alpha chain [Streptosporangium canum]|uniref:Multifunctional fusion protein n=1 Tax=Streptosporangium canum TaxID=324952 RepID=A0A1I3VWJ5_9ACTN|nr:glycine--tRNA ligase [Streptosporangium canum]SFJ99605.1 glycyl-tRNA synthetase beta chain /glycyl-tRNA synthetase alpha chain [Streptosporangium canum]